MKSIRSSVVLLMLANAVPIFGVVWFDWSVYGLVMLYWAENVIIGVINIARMMVSRGGRHRSASGGLADIGLIPFFAIHYGGFCYFHHTFIQRLFEREPWSDSLWIGVAALVASHAWSFGMNFIGDGEYRRIGRRELMHRPYGRVLIMQFTVIVGAFLMQRFNEGILVLVALVFIKTAIDWKAHLIERQILARKAALS
ncbi:MAG: DUF6498-containing protein [Pseudomonadota bacterium]